MAALKIYFSTGDVTAGDLGEVIDKPQYNLLGAKYPASAQVFIAETTFLKKT